MQPETQSGAAAAMPPFTVVKIGGAALQESPGLLRAVAELQRAMPLILVHGGGKVVSQWLGRLQIMPEFVRGLRKTDAETLDVAAALLAGKINSQIVTTLKGAGVNAVGLSGTSLMLGWAEDADLGLVATRGEADGNAAALLGGMRGMLPVIAPLVRNAEAGDAPMLNMNADTFAGALARSVGAPRLLLVTDQEGVLDKSRRLIPHMTAGQARDLMEDGVAVGGMLPKIAACLDLLDAHPASRAGIVGPDPEQLVAAARGRKAGTAILRARGA